MRFGILFSLAILAAVPAFSSPRVNNGGGAYACVDEKSGKAKWIRPVEVFEVGGIRREEERDAWEVYTQKRAEIDRDYPKLAALLQKHDFDLKKTIKISPKKIAPVLDGELTTVGRMFANKECDPKQIRYVQVANFLIDGTLIISGPVWNDPAFSEFDKAIILMHEYIYKVLRSQEEREVSSRRAQVITGYIFKNQSVASKRDQIELYLNPEQVPLDTDQMVSLVPVTLRCWAQVGRYGVGPYEQMGWRDFKDMPYGANLKFTMAGFRFQIQSSAFDGIPQYISIEDANTNVMTDYRDGLRTQFLAKSNVHFHLTRKERGEVKAEVRCMNIYE